MSSFRPWNAQVQKHGQSTNADRIMSRETRLFNHIQMLRPQEGKKQKQERKIPKSRPSRLLDWKNQTPVIQHPDLYANTEKDNNKGRNQNKQIQTPGKVYYAGVNHKPA